MTDGPIFRASVGDQVADEMRRNILSGTWQPGYKINARALSRDWGISHIPIREAVRTLISEGLVDRPDNGSPVVVGLDVQELDQLYALRRAVEMELLEEIDSPYTKGQVQELNDHYDRMAELDAAKHHDVFWAAHQEFHWALLAPSATKWSRRIWTLLWQGSEQYHRLFVEAGGSLDWAHEDHRNMVEAATSADFESLKAITAGHLQKVATVMRDRNWPPCA